MSQHSSLPCSNIREDLTAWLDGELPAERRGEVAEHLRGCAECSGEQRALSRTWDLLDYVESIRPLDEWTRRFRARVAEDRSRERWRWGRMSLAAAAVLLVTALVLLRRGGTPEPSIDPFESDREVIAVLDRIGRDDFEIGLRMPLLDHMHILENLDDRDLETIREERFSDAGTSPDRSADLLPGPGRGAPGLLIF